MQLAGSWTRKEPANLLASRATTDQIKNLSSTALRTKIVFFSTSTHFLQSFIARALIKHSHHSKSFVPCWKEIFSVSMSGARHWEQDKDSTIYIGNLDERVTDALVWELFLQAGRIVNVHLPKDRVTQTHQGYGFVEFNSEEDAEYAARIMNQVRLFGKPIRVNKASADKQKSVEVGAELFVGNLDPMVDERMLYDTFSRFGTLVAAPKARLTFDPLSLLLLTDARLPAMRTTCPKAMALFHSPILKPRTMLSPI